jgi:hypothetical protein
MYTTSCRHMRGRTLMLWVTELWCSEWQNFDALSDRTLMLWVTEFWCSEWQNFDALSDICRAFSFVYITDCTVCWGARPSTSGSSTCQANSLHQWINRSESFAALHIVGACCSFWAHVAACGLMLQLVGACCSLWAHVAAWVHWRCQGFTSSFWTMNGRRRLSKLQDQHQYTKDLAGIKWWLGYWESRTTWVSEPRIKGRDHEEKTKTRK